MRFRAEQHLCRPSEIRAVREKGERVDCRAFTIWWKRRASSAPAVSPAEPNAATRPAVPDGARVCVIASTAAVGGAIQRNRAKRRLREIFRQQQDVVPHDCDLLLIARSTALEWPLPDLQKKFSDACRRMAATPSGP